MQRRSFLKGTLSIAAGVGLLRPIESPAMSEPVDAFVARTELIVLVRHPMETGQQRGDEAQWSVPADYIDKMIFELNGAVVAEARLGRGISSDPLTGVALKKAKVGDRVTVSWVDNRGERGIAETIIT